MHHCNYPYHPGMVYLPTWMVDFYDRLVGKYTIVPWMGHGLNVQKNCHLQQLLRLISTSYRRSWVHCFRPRSLKCLWQQNGNGTPNPGFSYTPERWTAGSYSHHPWKERTLTFENPPWGHGFPQPLSSFRVSGVLGFDSSMNCFELDFLHQRWAAPPFLGMRFNSGHWAPQRVRLQQKLTG